jgi:hypothetical protein
VSELPWAAGRGRHGPDCQMDLRFGEGVETPHQTTSNVVSTGMGLVRLSRTGEVS